MDVSELRNYNVAFSDAEGSWSPEVKARLRREGKAIVMRRLGAWQKIRFGFAFAAAKWRARRADLSAFRERGLDNEAFIAQQLEYICMFSALTRVLGSTEAAIELMKEVMDSTADALLLLLPEHEDVRAAGPPMEVYREYLRVYPEAGCRAGCHTMEIAEDTPDAFQFNVTWCVWLELARELGVPEACIPNCYADDLVFPEYFRELGIRYNRTQTLANGGRCCDFRFERMDT